MVKNISTAPLFLFLFVIATAPSMAQAPSAFTTFVGGSGVDLGAALFETSNGDIVYALSTTSADLPVTDGAFQNALADENGDVYLVRFRPSTAETIWATYYGSNAEDIAGDMVCDEQLGTCVLAGGTSGDVPGTGTGKSSADGEDAWSAGFDLTTGALLWAIQILREHNQFFNAIVLWYERESQKPRYAVLGYTENGAKRDPLICEIDSDGAVDCKDTPMPGDQTIKDACSIGEFLYIVGQSDQTPNETPDGDIDPLMMVLEQGAETASSATRSSLVGEPNWYTSVSCDAGAPNPSIAVTEYRESSNESMLACIAGGSSCGPSTTTRCLNDPQGCGFCLPHEQTVGIGYPSVAAHDPTGAAWIVTENLGKGTAPAREHVFAPYLTRFSGQCSNPMSHILTRDMPAGISSIFGYRPGISTVTYGALGDAGTGTTKDAYNSLCPSPPCGVASHVPGPVSRHIGVNRDNDFWDFEAERKGAPGSGIVDQTWSGDVRNSGLSSGWWPYDPLGSLLVGWFPSGNPNSGADVSSAGTVTVVGLDGGAKASHLDTWAGSNGILFANFTDEPVTAGVRGSGIFGLEPGESQFLDRPFIGEDNVLEIRDGESYSMVPGTSLSNFFLATLFPAAAGGKRGTSAGPDLMLFDAHGTLVETKVVTSTEDLVAVPSQVALHQNYPNPFNPSTQIRYDLASTSAVRIQILTVLGQRVREINVGQQPAGEHAVSWDGRNQSGVLVPSGTYLYRLETDSFSQTRLMSLAR